VIKSIPDSKDSALEQPVDRAQDNPGIRRRHVFHIAGYDPAPAHVHFRRFLNQLEVFKITWGVKATVALDDQSSFRRWTILTEGPDWHTQCAYELLAWDDIIQAEAGRSEMSRLWRGIIAYVDLIGTGTIFRYLMANWQYFFFTIFPILQLGFLVLCAAYAAILVVRAVPAPPFQQGALIAVVSVGFFLLLLKWPGKRWRIQQSLDDWILSEEYIKQRHPGLEARLNYFARRLTECTQQGGFEEIIIVGHSLGATLAVDAVARALKLDPSLGRRGTAIALITVGATIPKCALHPHGQDIRAKITVIQADPHIFWVEYQARADMIGFYRFDPAGLRRISKEHDEMKTKPIIRRVRLQSMLRPATFAKYRLNFLRLHYQFVMANDCRYSYDYFMLVCGPFVAKEWTSRPGGLLECFKDSAQAKIS